MRPLRSPFQLREREKTGDISGYLGLSTTAALRRAERDTDEFAYRITFKANKKKKKTSAIFSYAVSDRIYLCLFQPLP